MKKLLFIPIIIFALTVVHKLANAQYTQLHDFGSATDGYFPYASLVSDGTFLYGMTSSGGTDTMGIIFKMKTDGTGYTKLLDFTGSANGRKPLGSLIFDGTFLYGMTIFGGTQDSGTIFKIKPDGTGYFKLLNFSAITNGSLPNGSLISDGTFLYGMTGSGGAYNNGNIFKIKPDGTGYSSIIEFDGYNGASPLGSLFFDGTFLYGMTYFGGADTSCWQCGVVFKIKPDGTGYSKLLDFNGTNGKNPWGSLISDGTFLYGMTFSGGGGFGYGNIFKIKSDGTGYSDLLDFNTSNGRDPQGDLIFDGIFLYGMTSYGGSFSDGLIFKIKTDGTGYSKLLDFDGSNGSWPGGSLISDGISLYGMTSDYGAIGGGTIFKFHPLGMGIAENNSGANFTIYPNPFSSQAILQTDRSLENATLSVYDSYGQAVKQVKNISGQSITLHRDNLPSGLYFLRLMQEGKIVATDKLVVTDN